MTQVNGSGSPTALQIFLEEGLRAELPSWVPVGSLMAIEFNFTPELQLADGRVIRNLDDAVAFAREHEARPGVDIRDEVLHALERARTREEAHAAAHLFLRWLEELDLAE